jgi:hypothetical protein
LLDLDFYGFFYFSFQTLFFSQFFWLADRSLYYFPRFPLLSPMTKTYNCILLPFQYVNNK